MAKSKFGEKREEEHLPSCRTTRNETRKGTRQKNNFSCRQRISNCWEDYLLASDVCVLPAPSPSQVNTWRSPCNLPRQSPGTPCARSTRILKPYHISSVYIFVPFERFKTLQNFSKLGSNWYHFVSRRSTKIKEDELLSRDLYLLAEEKRNVVFHSRNIIE